MSVLSDRIRDIVRPGSTERPRESLVPNPPSLDLSFLGGDWQDGVFIVERRWQPSARHGRDAVGTFAECLDEGSAAASLFLGNVSDAMQVPSGPFTFFDLETTGLSGGAGTYAFLVGCGRFEADGAFVTRQFLMTRAADERPMLAQVARELTQAGALVSFNGKSFDAPVLETRYLFHRLEWPVDGIAHVDALHPARRFWGGDGECSLVVLERQLLGVRRVGDVSGFEVPARYFQFVRTGDARPLGAVLEHNRLDLLSLAAITARLLRVATGGPDCARDAREALALGRVYFRAGFEARALDALRGAIDRCRSPRGAFDPVRAEALRLLGLALRRARRFDEAARCWQELIEMRGCPPIVAREAAEALAIHHEHRVRDLVSARLFALRIPENARRDYRMARLERKLARESLKSEVRSLGLCDDSDFKLRTSDLHR